LVQTLLKGSAGAATGLLGVLLAGSGLVSSLTLHTEPQVFTVALIFGCAQYLFTRLIDRQAKDVLSSASSRGDRGLTPPAPEVDGKFIFVTVTDEQAHRPAGAWLR
jgi:hypothetical protein